MDNQLNPDERAAPQLRARTDGPPDTSFTSGASAESGTPVFSSLSAAALGLRPHAAKPPRQSWPQTLRRVTGGAGLDDGAANPVYSAGLHRANHRGTFSIAVLSLKGGVGKSTVTVGLGATFAASRGDRVIAVDANPDFGTLAQRGPNDTASTVRTLIDDTHIERYSDVRRHTSQSPSRLEFLGSERDPAVSEAFSQNDYRAVHAILDRFYNIILTDCGTGLTHSALAGVLERANAIVIVGSPAIDSARSALATLDWLSHHGYSHLIPQATVVLNSTWSDYLPVDIRQLKQHFDARVRNVFVVPYDDHLAEGGEISLAHMHRHTRQAYVNAALSLGTR